MGSKRDFKITPIPETLKQKVVEVRFRLDDGDVGKPIEEVFKVEDDMMVSHLSRASMHNGLIMGDRILKINGMPVKQKQVVMSTVAKGGDYVLEVSRRENALMVTAERLAKVKALIRPGFSYFVVTAIRPAHFSPSAPMGMTVKAVKNRALLTSIEPNSLTSMFFALGDTIVDFDGATIPFGDTSFIREEIGKFQRNGKFTVLVERPVTPATVNELRRYLLSIMPPDSDVEMAPDVKAIGLEASNMHAMIFKKLKPPSILSADVRRTKNRKNTMATVEDEKGIKISAASTEMRITSDVEDEEDLKDVVKKSHAASGASGFFDDE
ncbi:unnamed protein product [Caenorhabditis bovis]|uniref:PDZ domain-containing protein n=1 Tax=Caenorhabditis bovis TaxID=2654633 RepID=A0A8S1F012_9PELO|nr:unnamed protein product [Caenorhabditis bovis]